jgi:hypothetical protein
MTKEEGAHMCNEVVRKWAARIRARWPRAEQEAPRCLEPMILNGSRATDQGWKVSYHVIYPWLTFPCNNTTLRDEVTRLSEDPCLQYKGPSGVQRFIDPAVYTRNRQFRLPLCYTSSPTGHGQASACQVLHFFRHLAGHASPRSRSTHGGYLRSLCRRPFGLHAPHGPLGACRRPMTCAWSTERSYPPSPRIFTSYSVGWDILRDDSHRRDTSLEKRRSGGRLARDDGLAWLRSAGARSTRHTIVMLL